MEANLNLEEIDILKNDEPKPEIGTIQEFFAKRLNTVGERRGITVTRDFLGNKIFISKQNQEETLAGSVPATLVVSPDGADLVGNNKGLLQRIASGDITHTQQELGGYESRVYRVALNDNQEFALKYTFPLIAVVDPQKHSYFHTSGVVAMRCMQLAERERPIPFVSYVVPLLATHDMTLAPFVNDGVSTVDFLDYLQYPTDDLQKEDFFEKHILAPEQEAQINEMLSYEANNGVTQSFYRALIKVMDDNKDKLQTWVNKKIEEVPEFAAFHFNADEADLTQSALSIEGIYSAFKYFKQNSAMSPDDPEFVQAVLESLALVELGAGLVEAPPLDK